MSFWVYLAVPAGEIPPSREVLLQCLRSCSWLVEKDAPEADESIRRRGRNNDGDVIACFSFEHGLLDVVDEREVDLSFAGTVYCFANPWVQVQVWWRVESFATILRQLLDLADRLGMRVISDVLITPENLAKEASRFRSMTPDHEWNSGYPGRLAVPDGGPGEAAVLIRPLPRHLERLWREMHELQAHPQFDQAIDVVMERYAYLGYPEGFVNLVHVPRIWLADGREAQVREALDKFWAVLAEM